MAVIDGVTDVLVSVRAWIKLILSLGGLKVWVCYLSCYTFFIKLAASSRLFRLLWNSVPIDLKFKSYWGRTEQPTSKINLVDLFLRLKRNCWEVMIKQLSFLDVLPEFITCLKLPPSLMASLSNLREGLKNHKGLGNTVGHHTHFLREGQNELNSCPAFSEPVPAWPQ